MNATEDIMIAMLDESAPDPEVLRVIDDLAWDAPALHHSIQARDDFARTYSLPMRSARR